MNTVLILISFWERDSGIANTGGQEDVGGPQASLVYFQTTSRKTRITLDFPLLTFTFIIRSFMIDIYVY